MPTPVVTENENEEPVPHDQIEPEQIEPVAMDEGEPQQSPVQEIPVPVALGRPQRIRKPAISDDYEVYNSEEI